MFGAGILLIVGDPNLDCLGQIILQLSSVGISIMKPENNEKVKQSELNEVDGKTRLKCNTPPSKTSAKTDSLLRFWYGPI